MTPEERIGALIAAALDQRDVDVRALRQAIGEHLDVPGSAVEISYRLDADEGVELTIGVRR